MKSEKCSDWHDVLYSSVKTFPHNSQVTICCCDKGQSVFYVFMMTSVTFPLRQFFLSCVLSLEVSHGWDQWPNSVFYNAFLNVNSDQWKSEKVNCVEFF